MKRSREASVGRAPSGVAFKTWWRAGTAAAAVKSCHLCRARSSPSCRISWRIYRSSQQALGDRGGSIKPTARKVSLEFIRANAAARAHGEASHHASGHNGMRAAHAMKVSEKCGCARLINKCRLPRSAKWRLVKTGDGVCAGVQNGRRKTFEIA